MIFYTQAEAIHDRAGAVSRDTDLANLLAVRTRQPRRAQSRPQLSALARRWLHGSVAIASRRTRPAPEAHGTGC